MTEVQKLFPVVKQLVEKTKKWVKFGSALESNNKYMNKEGDKYMNKDGGVCMEGERKVDSFTMMANVVKKFEDSGPFPWRAGDVERIVGL